MHNLCFEQNCEFLSEHFQFLVAKFSIYLNRRVFVMGLCDLPVGIICRQYSVNGILHGHILYNGSSFSTGPEVIKLFSCSTQLSMKFSLLINMKMPLIFKQRYVSQLQNMSTCTKHALLDCSCLFLFFCLLYM